MSTADGDGFASSPPPPQRRARAYADANDPHNRRRFDLKRYPIRYGNRKNYSIKWRSYVGEGTYGAVYLAVDRRTQATCVVKTIKPAKASATRLRTELRNLQLVRGGPNIVEYIELIKDEKKALDMLVFEYVVNPPTQRLYTRMSDLEARWYLYELLRAIDYTHSQGLMHLDIKPNNTLCDMESRTLRLIDWGFAAPYYPGERLSRWPGTRYCKAPEIFLHYSYYDYAVDMWAYACIVGSLVFQRFPFFQSKRVSDKTRSNINAMAEVINHLGLSDYKAFFARYKADMSYASTFAPHIFKRRHCRRSRTDWRSLINNSNCDLVSDDVIDLLDQLLVFDPEMRLSAPEALQHPYFDPVRIDADVRQSSEYWSSSAEPLIVPSVSPSASTHVATDPAPGDAHLDLVAVHSQDVCLTSSTL